MNVFSTSVTRTIHNGSRILSLTALLLAGITASAVAKNAPLSDDWQFSAYGYMWGAGIGGESATGTDLDISFSDILDNLDISLMGGVVATKGRFTLLGDFIYMDLAHTNKDRVTLGPDTVNSKIDIEMTAWVINLLGGYKVYHGDTFSLDVVGGARYLDIDIRVDARVGDSDDVDGDSDIWNSVVGLSGKYSLTDKWFLTAYGDVGTGDTNLTWQARVGIRYVIELWELLAGYRYLAWEFDDGDTMGSSLNELTLSGPYFGVGYNF